MKFKKNKPHTADIPTFVNEASSHHPDSAVFTLVYDTWVWKDKD